MRFLGSCQHFGIPGAIAIGDVQDHRLAQMLGKAADFLQTPAIHPVQPPGHTPGRDFQAGGDQFDILLEGPGPGSYGEKKT